MRRHLLVIFAIIATLVALSQVHAYQALQVSTEMRYWNPSKADNGYTLFGVSGTTYLIDMEGRVVHTWPIGTNPHLLDNGDVLDASNDDPSGFGGFKEVDWSGNTVWSYTETRTTYHPHHDFTRIYNPKLHAYTTLYIANKDFTQAQLIAAGANPATTPSTGGQMDAIVEVDSSGNIVWEWCFLDHTVQDLDSTKLNYVGTGKTIADYPGKLNINLSGHPLKSDWLHCNSLDYNQNLDQIVVNSVQGEFYVIDHGNTFIAGNPTSSIALAATTAGDFLYRFGDPARYNQGTTPAVLEDWTQSTTGTKQLGGAHDIQWIADGLNGAGHFLIFNNAEYLSEHTSQSYVMEIDPYRDASGNETGHYVNPPDAGYYTQTWPAVCDKTPRQISKQVVYNYFSKSNLTIFSHIGCSAQRLPNGNTLICADTYGYVTEVTPDGETVWDYIVPKTKNGTVLQIGDCLPMTDSIFRAYRYKSTHPALAGRTLTGNTTIAGRTTVTNPYLGSSYSGMQRNTEVQYWDQANAYNGYTLFGAQGTTYLIDMRGGLVKTWPMGINPKMLANGNLLDSDGVNGFKELDWSGNTAWQYSESRSTYHPHSDFVRIFNPKLNAYTTLYIAAKDLTSAQCLAAGCDPADAPYDGAQADTIVEVDSGGNVIWEWSFFDHGIQDVDSSKANYVGSGKTISSYPGKLDLNLPGRPVSTGWPSCNSIDYNQTLDQIVINSQQGEFYIIDHGNTFLAGNPTGSIALAATTAGDFLYRFGDPARYEQGSAPSVLSNWESATNGNKQIGASNDVHWIASGLTGAGHLMVFNNNQYSFERTPQSFVFEINPYLNSSGTDTGAYVNPPTAGYNTWTFDKDTMKANQMLSKQVVWKYGTLSNLTLFSHFGSSAQRLPNGNTLICSTTQGYLSEVTSDGTVVWEYINPVTADGVVKAIGDCLPMTNAVPRAYRYASSFSGFTGHTLTAGATIAGNISPVISNTTRKPYNPTASNSVYVTSKITDDGSISSASLSYVTGSGTATTTTAFTETMCSTAVKPWTGSGAVNAWTVTGTNFEQRTGSNYGSGNACGVQFKGGTTQNALTSAMIATTNSINAAGASGYVEFYIQTLTLDGTDGWTFQTDSGSGYTTRLSELTGSSHNWQKYHYDLGSSELINGLKLRFQFTGGGTGDDDRIDLDQINVTVTSSGATTTTVSMYDDGAHGDGAAGDHVYGALIPAMAIGTTVKYYLTATDDSGFISVDPASAPTGTYSYTVRTTATAPTITSTAHSPSSVTSLDAVWVTSSVTDLSAISAVSLIYDSGMGAVSVPMYDDGSHHDSAAGDGIYGAQIPAASSGSMVSYYISATNDLGLTTVDPLTAPTAKYSYSVTSPVVDSLSSITDGTSVKATSKIVTAYFGTFFYIEAANRAWGVRVDAAGPAVGTIVTVDGTLQTINGERRIGSATVTSGTTGTLPGPLCMLARHLGGSANGYTPGVTGGSGLNNIGLLIRIYGKVIEIAEDHTWFKIDDGSFSSGVKVLLPAGVEPPGTGSFVTATGISSLERNNDVSLRLLRVRETGDVTIVKAAPVVRYLIPDTGQITSYTAVYGEDSDYAINPPSYQDNGDGTVTDLVTGLEWQQSDGGEMTWDAAVSYASALSLGGHDDWRLPTANELYYILNQGTINPAMNTTYFPATLAEYWWTSEQCVDDANKIWVSNAGGGTGAHPKTETISAGGSRRMHARCVRGAVSSISPSLTANGDGTVTDSGTGLIWQQAEASAKTWEEALSYAESLSLGGYTDWRLPNIKELRSISDDTKHAPSLNTAVFTGAQAAKYWSSTSLVQDSTKAWYLDSDYGLTTYDTKTTSKSVKSVRGGTAADITFSTPEIKLIPGGTFSMGDHFNYNDPSHPSDELPLHDVTISTLYMGKFDITNKEYCDYLNSALSQGLIEVRNGLVYLTGGTDILCETRSSTLYGTPYSGIVWSGTAFSVLSGRDLHPMVGVRWEGAVAYCNWLSTAKGYTPCYNLTTWACDFTKTGYRLPTEAEWEYAANGGHYYYMFPWGSDPNTGGTIANWEASGDPYESGDYPWTTPVGFYNGQLHLKTEFNWPGSQTSYQTLDGANGYGLYDMAGNVWQWINDWYSNGYYSVSPSTNPTGPTTGDLMPDGKPYRGLRGGNWFNGAQYYGHSRISNRDPGYYRGPLDPNHPYYHVGFRVALANPGVVQPGATLTPLKTGLQFGEGPAADSAGNVYFSDVFADTIYKWSLAGQLSTFKTNSGGANGLMFDQSGNLIACEADNGRVTSIAQNGTTTAIASLYNGVRFNEPNDLWVDPKGGVYFTDPVFWGSLTQSGMHVYYINAAHTSVTRVISDMTKPNGIIGTPDAKTLYVSDYGAGNTYKYTINTDGSLTGKTLFVAAGSDGMDIDEQGNVYLTAAAAVVIYNSTGTQIGQITTPDRPTNLCFGGSDRRTLFITTQTGLYSTPMSVRGVATVSSTNTAPTITSTTRTPLVPSASDAVWVKSTITDNSAVASAKLTYLLGSTTATTTTVFSETMCSTAVKPWTGTGAAYPWTVTGTYFEQRTGSNYGTGSACGMEYKCGATLNPLTSAMIATTNSINCAGTSAYVEFYIQTLTLDGTDGWTFQIDSGSGFVTRLSELSGSSHTWQKYHYDLTSAELVSTLKMRFQFAGGGSGDDDRIDLDQITVVVTSGSVPVEVTMYDDGAHGDGVAGDHIYGALIPAKATGTTVSYYVTATDDAGLSTTDPATAPTDKYSYTVGRTTPQLKLNEFMADASQFIASPDYPTQTVGLSVNTSSSFPGYTIVDPMHNKTTYLINNAGQVVNSWTSAFEPGRSAYLMPNGHLIRACMAPGGLSTGGGEGGRIEERDWNGNLVWYIDYATSDYMMHHDFKVLPNGNIIMLVAEKKTYAETIAAGFNPSLLDSTVSTGGFLPDSVVEIKPTLPSGGTVVWQWHIWDHMIQDYDSTKSNYGVVSQHPELIDSNGPGIKIPQFWNHVNGIDYNPDLDQIMLSARNHCEVWIIDHSTTTAQAAGHTGGNRGKGGDLLYRWGNPQQYDMGTSANQQLFHEHDTQWVDTGCPGGGNILLYNNGLTRPAGLYSTIDEITPPVDSFGGYFRNAGSAFGPSGLTWTYVANPPTSFYSAEISGCLRLPNGNTLVCEGNTGRLFEVNTSGTTVWQYQCPVGFDGILKQGDSLPVDPRGGYMTAVFKAQRYPLTYAAFTGRTMTTQGSIEIYPDWIEIKNPGATAVDMSGMYITNDLTNKTKWQVPSGVTIPAGGYLLFWADGQTTSGSRHMSFTLDKSGGSIALYDIDGNTLLDSVTYGAQITDISTGRYPDGTGSWGLMQTPTPGAVNTGLIAIPSVPIKQIPDGSLIRLDGLSVTAAFDSFFYAEASSRAYGIRVDKQSHGLSIGQKVQIVGRPYTNSNGERYISATGIAATGTGSIAPLGMTNKLVGGGQSGYQPAIAFRSELSNIGLLVRTWGKVTAMDTASSPRSITIDDGSGFGLKCILPDSLIIDNLWQWISVTGISSCEKTGSDLRRLIRVRSQSDIGSLGDQ